MPRVAGVSESSTEWPMRRSPMPSTTEPSVKAAFSKSIRGGNTKGAEAIGKTIAERAIAKGIKRVVFDRNGFLYHGRVRTVADAARKAGLEF